MSGQVRKVLPQSGWAGQAPGLPVVGSTTYFIYTHVARC